MCITDELNRIPIGFQQFPILWYKMQNVLTETPELSILCLDGIPNQEMVMHDT